MVGEWDAIGWFMIGFTTFFDSELTKSYQISPGFGGFFRDALAALLKFPPLESAVVQICLEFHLLTHLAQQVIRGFAEVETHADD